MHTNIRTFETLIMDVDDTITRTIWKFFIVALQLLGKYNISSSRNESRQQFQGNTIINKQQPDQSCTQLHKIK